MHTAGISYQAEAVYILCIALYVRNIEIIIERSQDNKGVVKILYIGVIQASQVKASRAVCTAREHGCQK